MMKSNLSKYLFCLIILSLLFPEVINAQLYNFKKYNTKNGLANSSVKYILQSRRGYLWMATQGGGLSRFDGKEFKNYSKKEGLISNDLSCLEEDNDGNLWIGSVEGLCLFDGVRFKPVSKNNVIGKTTIYNIYKDTHGAMWVSTDNKGLFIFKNDKIIKIDTSNGFNKNRVFAVIQENENSFWIGTHKGGIYNLNENGKIIAHIDSIPDAPKASVFCFAKSLKNEIYAGTNNAGLFRLKNKRFTPVKINGAENAFVGSIMTDTKNNTWLATESNGLIKLNGENVKIFTEYDGLSSNSINSVTCDYEGNLWIGTQTGGACMLKNDAVVTFTTKDGLNNNTINAVCKIKDGTVLASTMGGGLFAQQKSDGKFKPLNISPAIDGSFISTIVELSENKIICGTLDKGIFILNKKNETFTVERQIDKIENQPLIIPVLTVIPEENGNFWACTYGEGLIYFNVQGEIIKKLRKNNGLMTNELISFHRDYRNNFYIGQFTNPMLISRNNEFKPLHVKPPEELSVTWSIASDNKGAVFFGTQDGGLIIYNGGKFVQYSTSEGICSNYIQSVAVDNKGDVWLGTDKGVNKIKLDENHQIQQIRFYSTDEGLISPEVSHNGIVKDADGFVWICTADGLTRFDESNDQPNITPPKLALADIRLHYEHVDWAKYAEKVNQSTNIPLDLVLPYNENHLTFEFRALTVDHVKYKFILENLDENWSPFTAENQAVYSNIPPGKYTFRVKAINSFGTESRQEIVFSFEITPPFWKTWWFYIICGIIILSSLFFFFKWRTAKLEREKKNLEQKVNERTLELKHANENLSVALHDIKDSINYAERIQRAMLPVEEKINHYLPDSFILFRPRDVVSGDFYWFSHKDGIDYVAAVDCTGHGVPGAFMSMVGSSLLNEIVLTKGINDPSIVLTQLNIGVQNALKQRENKTRDGMDLAFCAIDYQRKKIIYAGANRSLWLIRSDNNTLEEIKATKTAIGGFTDEDQEFKGHEIFLNNGDSIYLHSDGFADQFGGPDGKKLMTKRFKEILIRIQSFSMPEQRAQLNDEITAWMGMKHEQVDDMLVIGIRF